jgi:hypothetical protein
MASDPFRFWRKLTCWVCLGSGRVRGPLYSEPCPNEHCPHRDESGRRR